MSPHSHSGGRSLLRRLLHLLGGLGRQDRLAILDELNAMERRIMSALEDLQAAQARVAADVLTAAGDIRDLASRAGSIAPDDSAALADLASKLNASADTLEAAHASLTAGATTTDDPPAGGATTDDPSNDGQAGA